MQVSLANKEKYSMLFLGDSLNFTYDNPGPINVDFSDLTTEQKKQLYFNWRRGVLAIDDENQIKSFGETLVPTQPVKSQMVQRPVAAGATTIDQVLQEKQAKLRKLLREKIAVIKGKIPELSAAELRTLVDLEKQTKNRQKLLSVIEAFLQRKVQAVSNAVGQEDVGNKIFNPAAQALDNSLDVVESELEDVTLIPSDKELG